MSSPSVVRIGGAADFDEVWRLLMLAHQENAIFKVAPDKTRWFVDRVLSPERIPPNDPRTRGVMGVIGPVGKLEGLVFLAISSMWYSYDLFIEEFTVFVDPNHRKSDHAQALIDWMKQQVDEVGLPLVSGVVSNQQTEAKCRLYRRKMPKAGEFFLLFPKGSNMITTLSTASS